MSTIQIIETGDGSHTLINEELNETYHSRHGARRESEHVFVQHGLLHWLSAHPQSSPVKILEVGLGTGLNAWLSVLEAKNRPAVQFYYTALEPYPLEESLTKQLNYTAQHDQTAQEYFAAVHQSAWNQPEPILGNFTLKKRQVQLQDAEFDEIYDVIYFDAFAPNKQPELWEKPIIKKTTDLLNIGGIWVTYSAKGQLKRDLKSLGLEVETLPGPPGKAEMVRAVKR